MSAESTPPSILTSLREVFIHVSPRRRQQIWLVLGLMLLGAGAELVSIGAILPFLMLLANPEAAAAEPLRRVLGSVGLDTPLEIIVTTALAFALSALAAAGVRLLLVWASQRFVFGVARELSMAVYRRTLYQPYAYHITRNTSETLAAINKAQMIAGGLLTPMMQAVSAGVISLFILMGLLLVDPVVALASGLGFSTIYFLVIASARTVMRNNGAVIANAQGERIKAVNEGLGGIRDVLLDRSQPVFVSRFARVESRLRRAQATNNFIAAAPRLVVEGLGMVLVAGIALMLSLREGGLVGALPVLGALALGAQRLLPLQQQIYTGWTAYMTSGRSLHDILDTLRMPEAPEFAVPRLSALPFEQAIVFEDVRFSYPASNRPALDGVDLTIRKGGRIGFVGKTGSCKSTQMDMVLGLLPPESGRILIDGEPLTDANRGAWQAGVAHVPQFIYLADATVAENIAFGAPPHEIDHDRVRRAAEQAELTEVIAALPKGYDTFVGERGVRLSGGQRQRIGIARALYKQASVLVFDEATSALDNETEGAVMRAIDRLERSLTILIIAHRMTTVENCDVVVQVERGRIFASN